MVFGGRTFGEVIRFRLDHEGGTLMLGLEPLQDERKRRKKKKKDERKRDFCLFRSTTKEK